MSQEEKIAHIRQFMPSFPDDCKVFGVADFSGCTALTSIPEGTVFGGVADFRGCTALTSIPEGTVFGSGAYFRGCTALTSIPEGNTMRKTDLLFFQNGAYVKADGIFAKVIQKRGNTYRLQKVDGAVDFWMVTDGKFTHAHGDTLRKAKQDFTFKVQSERFKSEPITEDTVIKIQHYRAITGACELGVKSWINQYIPAKIRGKVEKSGIKVKDLLPILEKTEAYGLQKFKQLIK